MILTYHKVYPDALTHWWVSVDDFYRQMSEIKCRNVVYLSDYDPDNKDHIVITFDGVYENVAKFAAPILKKFGFPFELFVIGDYVGKNNAFDTVEPLTSFANIDQLKELVRIGGRLQWHTRSHPNLEKLKEISELEKELTVPKGLRKLDPKGFNWFAYPHGVFTGEALDLVKKNFTGAVSSIQGNSTNLFKLNRVEVHGDTSFKKASICVIIPSYNYGRFLPEAVNSVLKQTRPPDEILITDDCSKDNTQEIALDYVKRHPGLIKYNRNQKNLGIVKHFRKAVGLTKSEYICFLGADNRMRSDFIEKTAYVLDQESKVAIAYTDFALFGKRAAVVYQDLPKKWRGKIVQNYYYLINFPDFTTSTKKLLQTRNFIHGSSMYKRTAYESAGGYKTITDRPEDHNLFLGIVSKGSGAKRVPEAVLEYRQHGKEQANIEYATQATLQFYQSRYHDLEKQLNEAINELERIKSSKFWKLLYLYKDPKRAIPNYIRKFKNKINSKVVDFLK